MQLSRDTIQRMIGGTSISGGASGGGGGASPYILPLASDNVRGGLQIGYTQSGKNYPVQLDGEKAYVNVPWTDHYSWADITDKPATATRWPAWSEVTNKPDVAIQAEHNNLLAAGNEFTFASSGFSGDIWLNYRTAGGLNGAITGYILGDGAGHALGTIIHSGNISTQSVNYATSAGKATNDSDGNAINSTYLKLSGGTMTGALTARANAYSYTTDATSFGISLNNSDLVGVNGIFTNDTSDGWTEGINFKRTNGNWDSLRALDGLWYIHANNDTPANGDIGLALKGSTYQMDFLIGSGNVNRGIYNRTGNDWMLYFNASNTILNYGNVGIGTSSPSQKMHVSGGLAAITNNSRTVTIGAQNTTGIHIYNDNSSPFFFNGNVCSNASKTYDLGSSTYPWGTLYAAGCNIYDTSPSVHVGTSSSARISLHWSSDSNRGLYDYTGYWVVATNGTNTFMMKGNVGIGTTSPSYKLHVSGQIYCTGGFTFLSDSRKKNIIDHNVQLSVDDIANAPLIHYTLKDDPEKRVRVGSIAQYWKRVLPESVNHAEDGTLSMNYDLQAHASVIVLARKVRELERIIYNLQSRIA